MPGFHVQGDEFASQEFSREPGCFAVNIHGFIFVNPKIQFEDLAGRFWEA